MIRLVTSDTTVIKSYRYYKKIYIMRIRPQN